MNCREFADFLMAYTDGELEAEEKTAFESHIRCCPPCLAYLESYKVTVRLGRECCSENDPVPPDVPDELVRAILEATRKRP